MLFFKLFPLTIFSRGLIGTLAILYLSYGGAALMKFIISVVAKQIANFMWTIVSFFRVTSVKQNPELSN